MKAVIALPSDFYTKQQASFRLMNTDNFGTTLDGVQVGATDSNELRTAVYIYSDHSLRVIADHEKGEKKEVYRSSDLLPPGEHTIELYGSVSEVAPWYFKVDGEILASGIDRLSPDSVPEQARVVTRITVGIDGAADQDQNPLHVLVKSFEIADYNVPGVTSQGPIATVTSPPPTTNAPTGIPFQPAPTPDQPTGSILPLSWNEIPIMPQISFGREFDPSHYGFRAAVTTQDAQGFYGLQLAELGWSSPFSILLRTTESSWCFKKIANPWSS